MNKYNIGDEVWTIMNNNVRKHVVTGLFLEGDAEPNYFVYSLNGERSINVWVYEKILFPTKEALIQSL